MSVYTTDDIRVIEGDCLDVLPTLAAGSVDAIVTDPPFFCVAAESWDHQWSDITSYLAWLGDVADQWKRILKPNGSLFAFAAPRMAARVECLVSDRFHVVNSITWQKDFPCGALKYGAENFRSFVDMSERIIFAELPNMLGSVLSSARTAVGMSRGQVDVAIRGKKTGLCYRWEEGDCFPDEDQWASLAEFMELPAYESIVRPFFARADAPHTDVWSFKPVVQLRLTHPCEKPTSLLKHILNVATRTGAMVLDCFAGSGSTGVACLKTGRKCILIEKDTRYIPIIHRRLRDAATPLFEGIAS